MRKGMKDRALIQMKKKKFITKEQEKVNGAYMMLEQTFMDIESNKLMLMYFKHLNKAIP